MAQLALDSEKRCGNTFIVIVICQITTSITFFSVVARATFSAARGKQALAPCIIDDENKTIVTRPVNAVWRHCAVRVGHDEICH